MEKKRILIAEDSSVIQNISRKVLEFQNFDIDSAKDGKEVLKMLGKTNYDAILMDINMPKMDGMECARQIRALDDEAKAKVPIIAITGNAKNYSMDDFQKAGIDDYLPKPINFDNLIDILRKVTE